MAEPLLDARAVSKTYHRRAGVFQRDAGAIQAVDQVTLSLKAGDTLGLVGESGCGKTTLAKILVGLVAPTVGAVFIRGQSAAQASKADRLSLKRAVQFVFQDPMNSLNPRMTVEETLGEPLAIHGLAHGDARRQRVRELLARVQLPTTHASRLPRELSGGERQRVGLARALAVDPEVLICDEPIASLDVSVGAQILELLRGLCAQRRTALLFISHDLRAVASLCHRVAVMKEGRLIESGPTDALLTHPRHPYTGLLIRAAELDLDTALPGIEGS